jgi:CBS domain-containing protein
MINEKLISSHIVPLKPSDSDSFALRQMKKLHVSHLPVVSGGVFTGLISEQAIMAAGEADQEVGNCETVPASVAVTPGQHIFDAMSLMRRFSLTLLPVVTETGQYLGVILLPDLLIAISELVGINEPGGIIVLEFDEKDYTLEGVVRAVESNDAKILNCFVTSLPGSSKIEVTIKVNRIEIGPLLQAFFRMNILVVASWSAKNMYSEGLRERFDALMNYLNI